MAVFRVEKTRDYTVMANHHLKNRKLTLKAKGLLSVMLSLPDTWDFTLSGLASINREGKDAIREAIKELENEGYVIRNRIRDERGLLRGTEYVIYEKPQPKDTPAADVPAQEEPALDQPMQEEPTLENPTLDKPTQAKPAQENPTQLNTNVSKTYPRKTYPLNPHAENTHSSIPHPSGRDHISAIRQLVRRNICYEQLIDRYDRERLDEIVELMVEMISAKSDMTISGVKYPIELVRERLLQLNSLHIEFIFNRLGETTTHINNIKGYMMTTLFSAVPTYCAYHDALVRHDLHERECRREALQKEFDMEDI